MSEASNFAFVRAGWPALHAAAVRAERHARPDPRAACFYARLALERAVRWLYDHDAALPFGSDDGLGALLHEPAFKQLLSLRGLDEGEAHPPPRQRRRPRRPPRPAR